MTVSITGILSVDQLHEVTVSVTILIRAESTPAALPASGKPKVLIKSKPK